MTLSKDSTVTEVRDAWVGALRSGEYHRGTLGMRRVVAGRELFCPLGVLCDLASKVGFGEWESSLYDFDHYNFRTVGNDGIVYSSTMVLPRPITEWAALSNDNGSTKDGSCVSHQNDYKGKTFEEIADLIDSGGLLETWEARYEG